MNNYYEVSNNSVSQGFQRDFSTQLIAKVGIFSLSGGGLFSVSNAQKITFSGCKLDPEMDLKIFNKPITIGAFYLWKPFSSDLRETNFGVISHIPSKHFGVSVGLNSRNFSFSKAAIEKYQILDDTPTNVREPLNLMYSLSFYQPINTKINLELKISNFDNYIIQQVTNPMAMSKLNYKVNSKLKIYNEIGLLQAGMLNIKINYFGFYCRGGMEWQIN